VYFKRLGVNGARRRTRGAPLHSPARMRCLMGPPPAAALPLACRRARGGSAPHGRAAALQRWRPLTATHSLSAGARVFGVGGTRPGPLKNTVGNANWGEDLNGAVVNSLARFNEAVAQLRSRTGRSPAPADQARFRNPAQWDAVESVLSTTDMEEAADAIDGNPAASIATLASLGIIPLVVTQMSCKTFDFVVDSPDADPETYFEERWRVSDCV
jgi:hypothetical protein